MCSSVRNDFWEDREIDAALAPLARRFPRQADLILDIRESLRGRRQPGACVRCFFQLVEKGATAEALGALRDWLERHIEVVAHGVENPGAAKESKRELEKLPLLLESAESMADYCRSLMECFHYDRVYMLPRVEMEFRYAAAERVELVAPPLR